MSEFDTQIKWATERAERETDRLVMECFAEIARLLDGQMVTVDGKECQIITLNPSEERQHMLFDFRGDIRGLDHIEFTVRKTGWGGMYNPDSNVAVTEKPNV